MWRRVRWAFMLFGFMLLASCFTIEIDEQVGGFVYAHAMQLRRVEFRGEALPDDDGEVLSRRDHRRNSGRELGYFLVHDVLQLLQVDDESRLGIDRAFNGDFESVVMAVSVGIIALAEDALVLLRSKPRIVIEVRCGKFRFACEKNHRKSSQLSVVSSQFLILVSRFVELPLPLAFPLER